MNIVLRVPMGISTVELHQLVEALEGDAAICRNKGTVSWSRMAIKGFYLAVDPGHELTEDKRDKLEGHALRAIKACLVSQKHAWPRLDKEPTGWCAPPPLSETAEAYALDEWARAQERLPKAFR